MKNSKYTGRISNEWVSLYVSGVAIREISRRYNKVETEIIRNHLMFHKVYVPHLKITRTREDFLSLVVKNEATGCLEWRGPLNNKGYGQFRISGHTLVHRYSYYFSYGDIPKGMCVLHRCDNPSCVNPEHLFLGTQDDNMKDMAAKGRSANKKISKDWCSDILRRRNTGQTFKEIALHYKVGQSAMIAFFHKHCKNKAIL